MGIAQMRGHFFLLIDFGYRPDGRGYIALGAGFVEPVVDCNQFTVRPLHIPRITDVWFARTAVHNMFRSPGRAVIRAEHRTDGTRFIAIGVSDAKTSIGEVDH